MATAGDGGVQTDGDDSPVDANNTSRAVAMPFTLIKHAYYACEPESRETYDTKTSGVSVDLQDCCKYLMASRGKRFQALGIKYDGNPFDVCTVAASNGHIDCLRQAHVAGHPWDWHTTEVACRTGHIECLMYVHSNGCEKGHFVSSLAAACAGQLCTLEYVWDNGFEFPMNILCTMIARFGSIESLRYLRSIGFGWDVTTTAAAASYNQLEFLKYLHQHGCPWDSSTCYSAAENGNLECLEYAHTNGCEWDIFAVMNARYNKHRHCFQYEIKHGCPCPPWLTWERMLN